MYLVEFYYKLVKAGRLTIDEVPIKFRERVRERIELKENTKTSWLKFLFLQFYYFYIFF